MDGNVARALDLLDWGESASLEEMTERRVVELRSLLTHCYAEVPYYRQLMRQRGIDPKSVQSLDDLRRFPVLTRDAIRRQGDTMIASNLQPKDYIIRKTGGSTGEPIASYVDHRTRVMETYASFRGDRWMGWRSWMKKIKLWGGSLQRPGSRGLRSRMRSLVLGHVALSAFSVNAGTAGDYARTILQTGPAVMIGYSSALYLLAQELAKLGETAWPVKAVFPTAAEMPADWARHVSRVFNCPVRRYYGGAEVNALGFQVEEEGPYLVPDEHVVIETVQPGTAEAETVPVGSLLVTSLFNRARPLIRYANGDLGDVAQPGELHPSRSCIRELSGRGADMFVLRDGTRLSANFGAKIISALKPPVKRFQFIQHEYDSVEFRYEALSKELNAGELKEIVDALRKHMGSKLDVDVKCTGDFVVSKGGKHRTMICRVTDASEEKTPSRD